MQCTRLIRKIAVTITIVLSMQSAHGQTTPDKAFFCSPGITVGYTFGAKLNFGFVLDAGVIDKLSNNFELRYGVSFYQYYVQTKTHMHRLRSFSLMAQTDFIDVKLGIGRARNKWGSGHNNRCITRGISYGVSFAYPNKYSPWIGFRQFIYPPSSWAWFTTPYNSVYIKYKYDIIQNTALKETVKFK
jgi:hypothetical protein